MCPTRQSQLLRRVTLPLGPFAPTGGFDPILEVFSIGPSTGPPPVDHRPVTSLALRGQLCRYSAQEVRQMVLDMAVDAMDIVVDLHDVVYLDAGALKLFVEINDRVTRYGGRLVLEGVPPLGRRIISICGLEHMLLPPSSGRWSSPGRPTTTAMTSPPSALSGSS